MILFQSEAVQFLFSYELRENQRVQMVFLQINGAISHVAPALMEARKMDDYNLNEICT